MLSKPFLITNRLTKPCSSKRCVLSFLLFCSILSGCQNARQAEPADDSQALYQQANESLAAGNTDLAIEQFEQVLKTDPSAEQAFTNLGLLYLSKNDNKSAKQAFFNALEQDKDDAIAYNHLAVIQRQEGAFQQALSNYKNAIRINPDYAKAHLNLGILYDIYLQDLPEALEQYERYQQLTENDNETVEKWIADIKTRIQQSTDKDGYK